MTAGRDILAGKAPQLVVALVVVATGVVLLGSGGGDGGTLRATFAEATQVVPGQEVRIDGVRVGSVGAIQEVDGNAVVELEIEEAAWPLKQGTTARIRFGTLSGYAGRFIDLDPGPEDSPDLPAGGVLTAASTTEPVEFDQLFNTFNGRARRDLQGLLDNAAGTVGERDEALARALEQGSGGAAEIAELMSELGAHPDELRTLIQAGGRTTAALGTDEAALRELTSGLGATLEELAEHATAQGLALEELPSTLRSGRSTLARLDTSVAGLEELTAELAPGARTLHEVAPTFDRTISRLREVAPRLRRTLDVGTKAAPDVVSLLRAGSPLLPSLRTSLDRLAPMLGCVRPYAPELGGLAVSWLGVAGSDEKGGYGRVNLQQLPPQAGAGTLLNSQQITGLYSDRIFYALPRPPGLAAGQPWFLPECGAGSEALDPSQDPETLGAGG